MQALQNENNISNSSSNNINNNNNNNRIAIARLPPISGATSIGPYTYTHRLPYGARRDICDLLDSDKSWQILGGQLMRLNATQLQLVGQAILRNCSPTEELLNRLDTANSRLTELYTYLEQLGHYRALEILKPYIIADDTYQQRQAAIYYHNQRQNNGTTSGSSSSRSPNDCDTTNAATNVNGGGGSGGFSGSLNTPTPSFQSIQPMAIMSPSEFDLIAPSDYQNQSPSEWEFVNSSGGSGNGSDKLHQPNRANNEQQVAPKRCHHSSRPGAIIEEVKSIDTKTKDDSKLAGHDPGDEIVRKACVSNRKQTSISDQEIVNQLRLIMQINYAELKQASNDFADTNILGNGGFASVYRGYWKGTDVAIKRLRCNLVHQALNELTILNSYRIDNILPIYGISIDGPEACLVYQFMANGSLDDRLSCKNNTKPLSWCQRALIAEGVAKGLYYLHTLRDKPLVHGDAKSANVLLDSQFVPKLGDFGLARQMSKDVVASAQAERATHCTVSSIHGTSVYLPPEYLRHKILSPAVDVYSYGIVLLEMATGKRAYDGKRLLIDFVEDELKSTGTGQVNLNLKDHRLAEISQSDLKICFELLLQLGVACAHKIKKKRPDMGQVLNNFAHFRFNSATNAALANGQATPVLDTNLHLLLPNGLSNTNSDATTRTLTPDLSAYKQANNHQMRLQQQQQRQQQPQQRQQFRHDSAAHLMSFEEDDLTRQQQQDDHYHQHHLGQLSAFNGNEKQADNQIDAMIPFLTELGISTPPQPPT